MGLKMVKNRRGSKLVFGVKNLEMRVIAHSNEFFKLNRMRRKSKKLVDFGQSYENLKIKII